MSARRTIVTISSVVVIGVAAIVWHFGHAELTSRRLAKEAAAYRTRAEQGDAEAQNRLGTMYATGEGVPKDYREAVHWYRKSAEQGYAKAEYNLSNMYRYGKGVTQDFVEAQLWCRKAAEQGNARAEEALGYLYYQGEGVPQNHAEAARWYRKSADQGDANAQYVLGYMYYYGYGIEKDRVAAMRLFRQAAAQGSVDAKRAVGLSAICSIATSKPIVFLQVAAIVAFGGAFLRSPRRPRSRVDKAAGVAVVLMITTLGFDFFFRRYVGYRGLSPALILLYFGRDLLRGAVLSVLVYIVHKRSTKPILIAAIVIFVAVSGFAVVFSALGQVPVSSNLIHLMVLSTGMFIPSAVLVWLNRNGSEQPPQNKAEVAADMMV